jgi:amino acid adenylation domain-containing protein
LHELIDRRLASRPGRSVLVFDGQPVTAAALRRRCADLAAALQARGVTLGGIVAVGVGDPVDRIAAVLAVWRAGAALFAVDPEQPQARLRDLVADADPTAVITDDPGAPWVAPVPSVVVPDGLPPAEPAPVQVGPDDLAYLIYTSGSTGAPKGIRVAHRSVLGYLAGSGYVGLCEHSVVLQLAPFTFDPWLREVPGALAAGATLVLLRRADQRDPERVLASIREYGVTDLLAVVPSMIAAMMRSPSFATSPIRLRTTLVSGESSLALRRYPNLLAPFGRVVNQYGTSESTLVATWHELSADDPSGADVIGRPIDGVTVRLLDDDLRPVPPGQTGEICIGGPHLALGYRNDPEVTARAFPTGPDGERVYRTGDLGRFLPGGELVYLGRKDRQLKIRGHRVEPREVELALLEDPAVAEVAVVGAPGADGGVVLAAYVVPRPGVTVDAETQRTRLMRRLPAHAVPAFVVPLTALPVGRTGKLDVAALPPVHPEATGAAPVTPLERALALLWAEVLNVPQVPADGNFFGLGGHSLLAARIAGRAGVELGLDVSVEQILRHPTVAKLAAAVSEPGKAAEPQPRHEPGRRRFPLSWQQRRVFTQGTRHGLTSAELGAGFFIVAQAYRLTGPVDPELMGRAVHDIVARHAALRTSFETCDGELVAITHDDLFVPVPIIPVGTEQDIAVQVRSAVVDEPFRLDTGPLLRLRLLVAAPRNAVLVLAMHHIVSDGWSFGIFLRELSGIYNAYLRGESPRPPELAVQYGDYALWQSGRVTDDQQAYWRTRLRGLRPLPVPTDRPRGGTADRHSARLDLALPSRLVRSMHALGGPYDVTLHMTLTGTIMTFLAGLCGTGDIALGTPIANRGAHVTEQLIGVFTNTLILRAQLGFARSFPDVLAAVREAAIEAYQNPDVSPETLVDSGEAPVRVLFVLQNAPLSPPDLHGVTAEDYPVPRHATKYDLVFSLAERRGGLNGYLEYRTALFEAVTAQAFAAAWRTLVEEVVRDPEMPVSALLRHGAGARPGGRR